jgi:osmotically-inducible protein OsmY
MADRYEDRYRDEPYRGERGYGREDRGFLDRTGDEVRSWFGDEDAERRRRLDERDRERGYGRGDVNRGWRDPAAAERGWSGERWGGEYGRSEYGPEYARSGYRPPESYAGSRFEGSRSPGQGYGWESGRGASSAFGTSYRAPYGTTYGEGERWRERGFTGRGPKGYQRSDGRINEDVCDRLVDAPEVDASNIEVKVTNGEVTLSGTVDDRWQKRRAEDLAENISGVREVHNNLRVRRGDERIGGTAGATTETAGAGTRR